MRERNPLLIALVFLLVVVIVRYGLSSHWSTHSVHEPTPTATTRSQQDDASETPSARNVTHDFRRRVAELRTRLETAPADTAALLELARLRFDAHDMKEAASLYGRYVDLVPDSRQAWLDLAAALAQTEDWRGAEHATRQLLRHFPDDPEGTYNLGAILANEGRIDEAAAMWHRTMESSDSAMVRMARRSLSELVGS